MPALVEQVEWLASEVKRRAEDWMVDYASAWAYLVNDKEKTGFTFEQIKPYF